MNQQNVDCTPYHQLFDLPAIDVTLPIRASCLVYPDQVDLFVAQSDGCALLAQDADAFRGEQAGNGVFDFALLLVVPEAAENAMRRTQSRQHTNHLPLSL